jgi:hypothetical protein
MRGKWYAATAFHQNYCIAQDLQLAVHPVICGGHGDLWKVFALEEVSL